MSAARARGEGKTPIRPVRVEDDLWEEFGAACAALETDRSAALRRYMEYLSGRPGVELPKPPRTTRRPKRD
jgi:hypothetical protein